MLLDEGTIIVENEGQAEIGAWVKILAANQPGDTLLASVIEVLYPAGAPGETVEFRGEIQEIAGDDWVVHGIGVTVTPGTEIEGNSEVGAVAKVEAVRQGDELVALRIKITPREEEQAEVEFEGIIESLTEPEWVVGGVEVAVNEDTIIEGTPQVGLTAEVRATILPDQTVLATRIVVETTEGNEVAFEGIIESIGETEWQVAGQIVLIDAGTIIDESRALAEVGMWAEVKAVLQKDGSLLATRIKIERPD